MATAGEVVSEVTTRAGGDLGKETIRLRGRGAVQTLKLGANSTALAHLADGNPAVVKCATGRGSVYYLATPLEPESYARLLDRVFERASVSRPLRVTGASGDRVWQIEARALRRERDWLLYVVNHNDAGVEVKLRLAGAARSFKDLRRGDVLPPDSLLRLAPGETRLMGAEQERQGDR